MKSFFLICFLCISGTLAARPKAETKEECYKSSGLTADDVKAVKSSSLTPEQQKVLGAYFVCFLKDRGILSDNGHFDIEASKKDIEPEHLEIAQPVLEVCGKDEGSNALETTMKLLMCTKEKSGNVLFETLDLF
uniref:Odorant binding protein 11 n=1 Tax=Sirex nitobei TaxID=1602346 RepID=A0A857N3H5_9HYME|nr:odorant binding protein 11 [Sirex nitobei]